MSEDKNGLSEQFEDVIAAKIAAETRIIELQSTISEKDARITELEVEVTNSLRFVKSAEEDRVKLFSLFLLSLTKSEKEALKNNLIKEYGLKECDGSKAKA